MSPLFLFDKEVCANDQALHLIPLKDKNIYQPTLIVKASEVV